MVAKVAERFFLSFGLLYSGLAPDAAKAELPAPVHPEDEIVVTARRDPSPRPPDYRADVAAESSADAFAAARAAAPGVGLFDVNATQSFVAMRGAVSLDESASADPSVALYVDDFYLGRSAATRLRVPDASTVEVYAGPQGARFGKNSLGGAVNFISHQPGDANGGHARILVGSPGRWGAEGAINEELSATVDLRVGGYFERHGSDVDNLLTDQSLGSRREGGGFAKMRATFGNRTWLWMSFSHQEETSKTPGRFLWFNQRPPVSLPVELTRKDVFQAQDPRTRNRATRAVFKLGGENSAAEGWQMIAGYQRSRARVANNDFAPGGGPAVILAHETLDSERSYSFEFRGWTDLGPAKILGGALARRANLFRSEDFTLDPATGSQAAVVFGDAAKRNVVAQKVNSQELAAFLAATYEISPRLSVELAGRYSWERKSGETSISGGRPSFLLRSEPFSVEWKDDWSQFTPRAMLAYRFGDSGELSATWSKGFKSGGFTNSVNNPVSAQTPFKPERATSYEGRVKWGQASGAGAVTANLFFTRYSDLQTLVVRSDPQQGIIQEVVNAGRARSRGLEFSYSLERPDFSISAVGGYLRARYTSFLSVDPARGTLDFTGQSLPLSPKWSGRLSLQGPEQGIGSTGIRPMASIDYKSHVSFFPDAAQSALIRDQTDCLDFTLALELLVASGRFRLSASNLLDQRPFTFANNASSSFYFPGAMLGSGARVVYGSRADGRSFTVSYAHGF